jgi:hypothetical protein
MRLRELVKPRPKLVGAGEVIIAWEASFRAGLDERAAEA